MASNPRCDPFAADRARRYEPDLPPARPEGPRNQGPSLGDLERTFGVGQPSIPAAQQRRVRATYRR